MRVSETVVLRWARGQRGERALVACVGGYGPVAETASAAADLLIGLRCARIPAHWEPVVRAVLALRNGG